MECVDTKRMYVNKTKHKLGRLNVRAIRHAVNWLLIHKDIEQTLHFQGSFQDSCENTRRL